MNDGGLRTQTDLDELIGELAEDYAQRLRNGEKPDIEGYTRRYPDAADAIRQILPALEIMGAVPGKEEPDSGEPAFSNGQNKALGDFEIVRELGRGGMGVVYEANQLSLSRRVALKVLPFAAVLDERQIQRFRNEALAAAQLDHPHIVDVYGVGCERSVHFYAMRYVEGDTLAEVIAELRRLQQSTGASPPLAPGSEADDAKAAAGSDNMPALAALSTQRSASGREFFRSVARIGVEVAGALDHAHQQGVIHRDIKPANVIIDATGKSWVTDFGLARMESGATLTMTGDLLGTLRYMSPEQALAKRVVVDHRTDVYSLGVTLYELLTLQPAYGDEDRHELLRKIAFEEPRLPRKLNPAVPEELETIVLKAIAKNSNDRYETAQEFADDLQRYLDDKPIRAKRPGLVQIAGQWMRRHRAVVTTAVSILVLAVIGLSISVGLIAHERNLAHTAAANEKSAADHALKQEAEAVEQRNLARDQAAEAERQRLRAEANVDLALQALDEVYLRLADERFTAGRELQDADREFLEKAVAFYEQVAEQKQEDPRARRSVAWAQFKIGHIYERLGLHEEAGAAFLIAIERFTPLVEASPDDRDLRLQRAESIMRYAGSLKITGQFEESVAEFDRAIPIYRQDDQDYPLRGRTLRDLAWCYAHRGDALSRLDRREEGAESLQKAVECNRRLTEQLSNSAWYRRELAIHLQMLADVLHSGPDEELAEQLYGESSAEYDLLAEQAGDSPTEAAYIASALQRESWRLQSQNLEGAIAAAREQIEQLRILVRQSPANRQYRQDLIHAVNDCSSKLNLAGRPEEATELLTEADALLPVLLEIWPDVERVHWLYGRVQITHGQIESQAGRLEAAEVAYRIAVDELTAAHDGSRVAWALDDLAWVLSRGAKTSEAIEAWERLMNLPDEFPEEAGSTQMVTNVREGRGRLAGLLYQQGRADEGERYWRQMLDDLPNAAVRYRLRIDEPGPYRLFVRTAADSDQGRYVFVRIRELSDGPGGDLADWYYVRPPAFDGDFASAPSSLGYGSGWFEGTRSSAHAMEPMVWDIPEPGEYTLEVLGAVFGTGLDRVVFQNASHDLNPTDSDLAESDRLESGAFIASDGRFVVNAVHFEARQRHQQTDTQWLIVPTESDGGAPFANSIGGEYLQLVSDEGNGGGSPLFVEFASDEDRAAGIAARAETFIELFPDDIEARLGRAGAYSKQDRPADAIADYTVAIDLLERQTEGWEAERDGKTRLAEAERELAAVRASLLRHPEWLHEIEQRFADGEQRIWQDAYPLALLYLLSGRTGDYQALAEQVFAESAESSNDNELGSRIVLCKLAPDALADAAQLVQLAESLATRTRSARHAGWWGHTLYRAGQIEAAIETLNESLDLTPGDIGAVWNQFFLAMCCQRVGREQEARDWLARANESLTDVRQATYTQYLDLFLLRAEAEQLITGSESPRNDHGVADTKITSAADVLRKLGEKPLALPVSINQLVNAYVARAWAYDRIGDQRARLGDYRRAIEVDPDNAFLHRQLAEILRHSADPRVRNGRLAYEAVRRAVELDPDNAEYLGNLGRLTWDHLKDREQALNYLDRAIALEPTSVRLYLDREIVHRPVAPELALEDIEAALRLDPNSAWAMRRRADVYVSMGEYAQALRDYNRAEELYGEVRDYWTHLQRARLHKREGRLAESLSDFSIALEVQPNSDAALRARGEIYWELGEQALAVADAERYLELKEFSASACNDAAYIVARNPDAPPELRKKSLVWARKAVESAPTRDDCWYTCGVAEYRVGHWGQAIEAFHRSSTLIDGRNLGWNAFFLAMAEHQLGHTAQADLWYRAGLLWMSQHAAEDRDAIRFRDEAAQLLTGSEEPSEPDPEAPNDDITAFTLAIEAAPDAGWPYSGRARAHLEQEHWPEAAADFERGLAEAEPQFRPWYELGLLQAHLGEVEGYRDTCRRMIDAFGDADDATSRHFAVWTSALLPAALDDYAVAVEIASKLAAETPDDPGLQQLLGAILLRTGRLEDALVALNEAERLREAGGDVSNTSPAYLWYLLSTVHADLGNEVESRDWLSKANEQSDRELGDADSPVLWNRKLTLELLRSEAEGTAGLKTGGAATSN